MGFLRRITPLILVGIVLCLSLSLLMAGKPGGGINYPRGSSGDFGALDITTTGDVGVGRIPTTALDIYGGNSCIYITGDNNNELRVYSIGSNDADIALFAGQGTLGAITKSLANDELGSFNVSGYGDSGWSRAADINVLVDSPAFTDDVPGMIVFYTYDESGTEHDAVYIRSAGNVGFGIKPTVDNLFHLRMSATDEYGVRVDGSTVDYTGTDTSTTFSVTRDCNVASGNIPNAYGIYNLLAAKDTDGLLAASITLQNYNEIALTGKTTVPSTTNRIANRFAIVGKVNDDSTYDADDTGRIYAYSRGLVSIVDIDNDFLDTGAQSPANRNNAWGVYVDVDNTPTLTGGAFTAESYGVWIDVDGNAAGTSTAYGIYIAGASDADTNYSFYDNSGADWVKASGHAGFGMNNPSVEVDVTGDIEYTGTITDVSDERLKENIKRVDDPISKLQEINGVYFNMIGSKTKELGLVAQNVKQVLPEAVRVVDSEKDYLGVSYPSLIPVLIEAVKEQQEQIDELKSELDALRNK